MEIDHGQSQAEHLIVLVHGLDGAPGDLGYLKESLKKRFPQGLIVVPTVNTGLTHDGVAAGGKRLADEVLSLIQQNPSIIWLSMVGNSLGGIYCRYALAHLGFDPGQGFFAGGKVRPAVFMTIATPHLGVRKYTYVPLPAPARRAVCAAFRSRSVADLFLTAAAAGGATAAAAAAVEGGGFTERSPLVFRMATDQEFLIPLKAFRHRRLYGNLSHDFMVHCETATMMRKSEFLRMARPFDLKSTRSAEAMGNSQEGSDGRVLPPPIPPADALSFFGPSVRAWEVVVDPIEEGGGELAGAAGGGGGANGGGSGGRAGQLEREMASALDRCGWQKIGIQFRCLWPDAHNKICAWNRNKIGEWYFKAGRVVMDNAASYIAENCANLNVISS